MSVLFLYGHQRPPSAKGCTRGFRFAGNRAGNRCGKTLFGLWAVVCRERSLGSGHVSWHLKHGPTEVSRGAWQIGVVDPRSGGLWMNPGLSVPFIKALHGLRVSRLPQSPASTGSPRRWPCSSYGALLCIRFGPQQPDRGLT